MCLHPIINMINSKNKHVNIKFTNYSPLDIPRASVPDEYSHPRFPLHGSRLTCGYDTPHHALSQNNCAVGKSRQSETLDSEVTEVPVYHIPCHAQERKSRCPYHTSLAQDCNDSSHPQRNSRQKCAGEMHRIVRGHAMYRTIPSIPLPGLEYSRLVETMAHYKPLSPGQTSFLHKTIRPPDVGCIIISPHFCEAPNVHFPFFQSRSEESQFPPSCIRRERL